MAFSVKTISGIGDFGKTATLWDCFVRKHTEDPYLLHEFLYTYMQQKYSSEWNPLFFIAYDGKEIVGIAPLMIKTQLGIRIANSLPRRSQSFIVDDAFREKFIDCLLDLLFQSLNCKTANLVFQTGTSELSSLERSCSTKKIYFTITPSMGHRILATEGTWEQFESLKGSNFRNRFKKMEKKLNRSGPCRVTVSECQEDEAILGKMLRIDKASWKEGWRASEEVVDQDLLITYKGAELAARNVAGFKSKVWLLELNAIPIAFALVFQNGKTAVIAKTSYDVQFKNYYPGMYVINAAIRDLFNDKTVNNVDFVTNLPFMEAWTPHFLNRQEVFLGKGFLVKSVLALYLNEQVMSKLRNILNTPIGKLITRIMPGL